MARRRSILCFLKRVHRGDGGKNRSPILDMPRPQAAGRDRGRLPGLAVRGAVQIGTQAQSYGVGRAGGDSLAAEAGLDVGQGKTSAGS